jgi:ABC-type multidrug transport system permease subunit
MSSKVNVTEIFLGHIATLSDPEGKRSIGDYITFFLVPGLVAGLGLLAGYNLNKDVSSMLVNFGAIFTALLLSVLVLVYDQESKLEANKQTDTLYAPKKELLGQLYYNICFSILSSIVLVALCFVHSVVFKLVHEFGAGDAVIHFSYAKYLITPLVIFVTANLLLTIVMIVKRMHAMLTI